MKIFDNSFKTCMLLIKNHIIYSCTDSFELYYIEMQNHVHKSSKIYQIVFIFASLWIEASCGPFLDYCKEIPYNLIAKCNITCDTCQAQQSSCDSCPSYLYYN